MSNAPELQNSNENTRTLDASFIGAGQAALWWTTLTASGPGR
jgi:hypothetical protein